MPTIELPPKRKRSAKERGYKPTERAAMASNLYNTDTWRRIRRSYLMEHPLCEICEEMGRITYATDVHHKDHISEAQNELDAMDRAFDSGNLMALCHKCHMLLLTCLSCFIFNPPVFLKAYRRVENKTRKTC